jgi:hypothetical protein
MPLNSILSNTLSTSLVFGPKIPQQFNVSARKSSNNCADKLSVYNQCTTCSVHLQLQQKLLSRQLYALYVSHNTVTLYCTLPYIHQNHTAYNSYGKPLCFLMDKLIMILPLQTTTFHLLKCKMRFVLNLVLKYFRLS